MKPIPMSSVLGELQALRAELRSPIDETSLGEAQAVDFAAVLRRAVERVNDMQREAQSLATAFERGEPKVDLVEVMVAMQKAGIAFQAATEVRNRLVRAYQDVMNMPI